ncbi:MAG: cobyrinate a,c-diamide synthase [Geminicoccaceae bacterium]|nr:cobyrinate a,c-diamide synthase [Geminicoccaceae bacterium]
MSAPSIIVSGFGTGAGKTAMTLGLIRALGRRGIRASALRIGMDPLDPELHRRASGRESPCIDSWGMRLETLSGLVDRAGMNTDITLIDGAGGLFDHDVAGMGSTADIAALFNIPVLLIIDAARCGNSLVAMLEGFCRHRVDVEIVGFLFHGLERSDGHTEMARLLDDRLSTPVLGWIEQAMDRKSRLRGFGPLTSANRIMLDHLIETLGDIVSANIDLDRLMRLARSPNLATLGSSPRPMAPIGQRIAVARDEATGHVLPAIIRGWQSMGAEIVPFSPLADEAPDPHADAVYLPDGPIDLFVPRMATNRILVRGLHAAAHRDAFIYGEGGGYIMLAEHVIDAQGRNHAMAGLLPVTMNVRPPMQVPARIEAELCGTNGLGRSGSRFRGCIGKSGQEIEHRGDRLFRSTVAGSHTSELLGSMLGTVAGSMMRILDRQMHLGLVRKAS